MMALTVAMASPSSASAHSQSQPGVVAAEVHPSATNTVSDSDYAAGWEANPANGLASASATFTIPTINCSSGNGNQLYFGWGAAAADGNQIASTIQLSCSGTTPTYTYWLITPAGLVREPGAAAGDVVVTSLFQTANRMEAEIHDLTNGEYWVAADAAPGTGVSPLLAFNEPYATAAIQPFTPVTFSSVQVNGDYLGFENPTQLEVNRGGPTLVKSNALSSYGSKFTVTFKQSS
jgi:hypothetical protein